MTRAVRAWLASMAGLPAIGLLLVVTGPAAAQPPPGISIPAAAEASDQKSGAVLVYNLATSSASNPAAQDTRITLTNLSTTQSVVTRLFFVDGSTGSATDRVVCANVRQTVSLRASSLRAGVTGFLVAITVDGVTGCPTNAADNPLSGQAHVTLGPGLEAVLGAVAVSALYAGSLSGCAAGAATATLAFDGVAYNRLPLTLQLDDVPSRKDGQRTFLVLNRIGGVLGAALPPLGSVVGTVFDDTGAARAFTFDASAPQLARELSNVFPATTPRLETVVAAGRTGWTKLNPTTDTGVLGAAVTTRPRGAANLRALTLTATSSLTMPVSVPPACP